MSTIRNSFIRTALGAVAGATVLLAAVEASAQTTIPCSSVGGAGAKIIYGAGGSAQLPLISQIGAQLAKASPPTYIVYSSAGSACAGYNYLTSATGVISGTANYWDSTGATQSCAADASAVATFAVMGNAPDLCPSGTTPLSPGYGQFLGPAQPVDFVVPSSSSQQSISTAAAFYVWGYGAKTTGKSVAPWTNPADIFTRSATSFVNIFTALDTGLTSSVVATSGTLEPTNTATLTGLVALNGTANAENGIGFVSGEVADGDRKDIRILAYQHTGQSCGYWPDSTVNAFDKVNVRSGQYWLWSPVHFFAKVDANNNVADANTASFIGLFTGTTAAPTGVNVFEAEYGAFTVPQCAMHAWRDGDLAEPYSFAPANPCSCEFDFRSNNSIKPTSCQTCTQDSDCSTQHCRNIGPPLANGTGSTNVGYCEAY